VIAIGDRNQVLTVMVGNKGEDYEGYDSKQSRKESLAACSLGRHPGVPACSSKVYGETCLQECQAELQACGAACDGVGTCIGECFDLFVACEKRCE